MARVVAGKPAWWAMAACPGEEGRSQRHTIQLCSDFLFFILNNNQFSSILEECGLEQVYRECCYCLIKRAYQSRDICWVILKDSSRCD